MLENSLAKPFKAFILGFIGEKKIEFFDRI